MRVVAGRWRGRRLAAPTGGRVRPTTDRVKEAIFSILGDDVHGALVLDLCCGAGGLGIEALSRGAREVVFVDRDRRALAAVRENLAVCGAGPDEARLVTGEATGWLGGPAFAPGTGPWMMLADPPYGYGLASELADVLAARTGEGDFRVAILEHGDDESPSADGMLADTRHYGTSVITILRPATNRDRGTGS